MNVRSTTRVTARRLRHTLFFVLAIGLLGSLVSALPAEASGGYYVGQGGDTSSYAAAYNAVGGNAAVGDPINTAHGWGAGCNQDFRGGKYSASAIMQPGCSGAAYAVVGHTWEHFENYFHAAAVDWYGYPYNNGHRWGAGWAQDFQGGRYGWNIMVYGDTVGRTQNVRGDILRFWVNNLGGAPGGFGFPTTDEYAWNGLQRQDFQGGSIVWDANVGARVYNPTPSREQRAVNWAIAEVNSPRPGWSDDYGRRWSGWCEGFVEAAYGNQHGAYAAPYGSAINDYYAQAAAGRVHGDDNPPAGALVFYNISAYGHVALALGDGRVISTYGFDGQTYPVVVAPLHTFGNYLGWSYANPAWGGR